MTVEQLRELLAGLPSEAQVYLPGGNPARAATGDSDGVHITGDENAQGTPEEREAIGAVKADIAERLGLAIDSPEVQKLATDFVGGGYRPAAPAVDGNVVLTPGTGRFEAEGN